MKEYDGSGLTPLFYSEISSSYMLYDIFNNQKSIAIEFIEEVFGVKPDSVIVERERSYPKKGSIDIFVEFMLGDKKCALLIEIKVHDYLSATDGQIITYYNAVVEDAIYDDVYFIYLTQFTEEESFEGITAPKTLDEASRGKDLINNRFVHISWKQLHSFLEKYCGELTEEQKLIVSLNRQWILQQCKTDLDSNRIEVGSRSFGDYFYDLNVDIIAALPFGSEVYENKRQIWRIDTYKLQENQLQAVLEIIKIYAGSEAINKIKQYKTEEQTLQGAKDFLMQLAQSVQDWNILSFYSRLFLIAEKTSYFKFNGTGTRGFSIKVEIAGKGEISLCTIYRNKIIDFSLKR
ncbi:MAG: PD-(D/E)XK nuclease family protein [Firmicutes bacterium]|nr:PD-(D/E)XK nuclease family protein [Bacillota bacterium]